MSSKGGLYSLSDWLVLPTLVFSQFAGTSLWFAPNAVVSQVESFGESEIAILVSCVQVGFIVGTLIFTYFALTDRMSPPLLFTGSCVIGAAINLLCVVTTNVPAWAFLRLLVGVCLAGVYPVGMKIAAIEYPSGLGARLGVLVGALTLGTAFPWLVSGIGDKAGLPFEATLGAVSALAIVGAFSVTLVMIPRGDGIGSKTLRQCMSCCFNQKQPVGNPVARHAILDETLPAAAAADLKDDSVEVVLTDDAGLEDGAKKEIDTSGTSFDSNEPIDNTQNQSLSGIAALKVIIGSSEFRAAAVGYCGHMWEIYAFWAHMPSLVNSHSEFHDGVVMGNEAYTSFAVIAIGAVSCSVGGIWSLRAGNEVVPGSAVVAIVSLFVSGCCCLLVPLYLKMSKGVFLFFLLVWGSAVVSDSAQFSSLTARYSYPGLVGTSLTLTTSVGFVISVVSIQLIGTLIDSGWDAGNALVLLAIGPAIGVYRSYMEWPLHRLWFSSNTNEAASRRNTNEAASRDFNSLNGVVDEIQLKIVSHSME